MKRLGLSICFGLFLFMIVVPSARAGITGPHNIQHIKGVCANCHIPHKAKGNRIWARNLSQNFGGVRQLCNSCHDGTFYQGINLNDPNSPEVESGINTVFGTKYETHVMHGEAIIATDGWLGPYDSGTFPLDPNDVDNVAGHPESWDKGGAGFYCGSCHNPHKQPVSDLTTGDYLRGTNIGEPGNRTQFCQQCHVPKPENPHLNSSNCYTCHHPHEGHKRANEGAPISDLKLASYILKGEVLISILFKAVPNVPGITEDPNDISNLPSSFCYGCHQPNYLIDPNDYWRVAGAAPIYGDQLKDIENAQHKKNHHPMGLEAKTQGGSFPRALGAEATTNLNNANEITCISCHAGLHENTEGMDNEQSKQNNFLRWTFIDDNAEFCLKCHNDKGYNGGLTIEVDKKHIWDKDAKSTEWPAGRQFPTRKVFASGDPYEKEVECYQCMFCHFIHDGEEVTTELEISAENIIKPDIDALMRQGSWNLDWGDRIADQDKWDYEDMCYGCHKDESIVGTGCGEYSSLLKWEEGLHTHRFASLPDQSNPPYNAIVNSGGAFPLSDGQESGVVNDYGTQTGSIFCGTCHSVHDNIVKPYLNHEPGDTQISPYEPFSFCEYCHDAESDQLKFVHNSHPIDKPPNYPITVEEWLPLFYDGTSYEGKSGCKGGMTYLKTKNGNIICLTCHNVHAAATNWKGGVPSDPNSDIHGKLLVKDNMLSTTEGSDMCQDCHPF